MGIAAAAVAVAVALGAIFALGGKVPFLAPPITESIRLGAYEGDVGALEWIAKDMGFFDQVGLAVEISGFPSGDAALRALREGRVDIATAADLVVASHRFDTCDLAVPASVARYWNKGFVARADHGIRGHFDLKGKRIAFPPTSNAEYELSVFLGKLGMSFADVVAVPLPPRQVDEEIIAGRVDGAMIWEPHVMTIMNALGNRGIKLMERGTEGNLLLVATPAFLGAHPAAVNKLLAGLVKAEEWARTHPIQAKKFVAERFNLAPAYLDMMWPNIHLSITLPQDVFDTIDKQSKWLATIRGAGRSPDCPPPVHAEQLRSIKPAAVTMAP